MSKEVGEVPMVFITNKIDLRKDTSLDLKDVDDFAGKFNSKVISTSAKTGENVEDAFMVLGTMMANMILDEKS
jgi:50S ribosomal subunit-associated GTPase HflX